MNLELDAESIEKEGFTRISLELSDEEIELLLSIGVAKVLKDAFKEYYQEPD